MDLASFPWDRPCFKSDSHIFWEPSPSWATGRAIQGQLLNQQVQVQAALNTCQVASYPISPSCSSVSEG